MQLGSPGALLWRRKHNIDYMEAVFFQDVHTFTQVEFQRDASLDGSLEDLSHAPMVAAPIGCGEFDIT